MLSGGLISLSECLGGVGSNLLTHELFTPTTSYFCNATHSRRQLKLHTYSISPADQRTCMLVNLIVIFATVEPTIAAHETGVSRG